MLDLKCHPEGSGPCLEELGDHRRGRVSSGYRKTLWGLCEDEEEFGELGKSLNEGLGGSGRGSSQGCEDTERRGQGQELGD